MLIEIQCPNLGDFDPATGRNSICGQWMMVDSNQIGQMVKCPKCEQTLEIKASKYDAPASNAGAAQAPSNVPAQRKPKPKGAAPNAGGRRPRNADAPVKTDVMDIDFSESTDAASPLLAQVPTCRKCGSPAPYGRCPSCRYVAPRYSKMHLPLEKLDMQLSGMQLWFCNTLREGMSIQALGWLCHALAAGLVVALFALSGLLLMSGTFLAGLIVGGIATSIAYGYTVSIYKGYQFVRNPRTKLSWFQRVFWNIILKFARSGNWESYDSRLKDRRVIKVSERGFTDSEIPALEGIRKVQVLDLENTEISDKGIAMLYRLEHLQCLVVKNTNVTHDAVVRLQQTFPKLWIWD